MSFFKNLFRSPKQNKEKGPTLDSKNLALDQVFVQNFIHNNGKFLYCTSLDDVVANLTKIIDENNWRELICNDSDLSKLLKKVDTITTEQCSDAHPIFITCEHLIAENGSILFSSNQLKGCKISDLSKNFIVYATTRQIVNSNGEGLTGIKSRYKGNIPSNISAIKNYNTQGHEQDFMNYGNTNTKNLYLLLFEDL